MVSDKKLLLLLFCCVLASFQAGSVQSQETAEEDEGGQEEEQDSGPPPEYVYTQMKDQRQSVKGIKVKAADNGVEYMSFRGIRYAKAPVGELRLKDPEEFVYEDDEELDASEDGFSCPQINIVANTVFGDEDCLNLNVYTKDVKNKTPVIVFIHGGAFLRGTGASYNLGPQYILKHEAVVVTLNYRLGPLGFMATSDKAATGNYGIKDQVAALKWVKANIAAFGGDPDNVTLMGEEAGAASVSVHLVSPASKGLFHKAVAMSGNAGCDQFFQPEPQKAAEELAFNLGCSSKKGEDIVECVRRFRQQEIVRAAKDITTLHSFPRHFVPVVDGTVLPDTVDALVAAGKAATGVPVVTGMPKRAGAFFYRPILNTFSQGGGYDDNFLDHRMPRFLPVISQIKSKLYPITRQVKKHYFLNVDMSDEDEFAPRFAHFLTDLFFTSCVAKFNNLLASKNVPTYAYSFDYRGQYSMVNLMGEASDLGVSVSDDLQYLFNPFDGQLSMSAADMKFVDEVYIPMVVKFAQTGAPSANWTKLQADKYNVMVIDKEGQKMEDNHNEDNIKFWHETIPSLFEKKAKTTFKKDKKDEL